MTVLESIESSVVDRGVAIWWLGGPSVVLKSRESVVYVDLFSGPLGLSPEPGFTKGIPDVLNPIDIGKADVVLSTHSHLDHCHRDSLVPIHEQTQAVFVGPTSSTKLFAQWGFAATRIVQVAPGDVLTRGGLTVRALPAHDWDDTAAVTYLIEYPGEGVAVFESGDTRYFPGLGQIGEQWPIDLALLNYASNPPPALMEQADVVQAARDLRAPTVIPKHWDIWAEMAADPQLLAIELENIGVRCVVLEQGGSFHLAPSWTCRAQPDRRHGSWIAR